MFYAHFVLSKKGPLARIWLAAHWDKKLTKAQIFETNIEGSVEAIIQPQVKLALRTSGHLLLGVVRIYSRKAKYLLADCGEALVKIKLAFRPGLVDLPEVNRAAAVAAITLPQHFHDFTLETVVGEEIPDFEEPFTAICYQSRPEEITLREVPKDHSFAFDDGFGDFDCDGFGPTAVAAFGRYRAPDIPLLPPGGDSDRSLSPPAALRSLHGSWGRKSMIGSGRKSFEMDIDEEGQPPHGEKSKDNGADVYDEDFGSLGYGAISPGHGVVSPGQKAVSPSHGTTSPVKGVDSPFRFTGLRDLEADVLKSTKSTVPQITLGEDIADVEGPQLFDDDFGNSGRYFDDTGRLPDEPPAATDRVNAASEEPTGSSQKKTAEDVYEHREEEEVALVSEAALEGVNGTTLPDQTGLPDQTTLIPNDAEAFALGPIDVTGVDMERKPKKKRRLVVDDARALSSEQIRTQLTRTAPIVTPLDLAPPTKRLMLWKELGGFERLFAAPARRVTNRALGQAYTRNLKTRAEPDSCYDDDLQAGDVEDQRAMTPARGGVGGRCLSRGGAFDQEAVEARRTMAVDESILADNSRIVGDHSGLHGHLVSSIGSISLSDSLVAPGNLTLGAALPPPDMDTILPGTPRRGSVRSLLPGTPTGADRTMTPSGGTRSSSRLRARAGLPPLPSPPPLPSVSVVATSTLVEAAGEPVIHDEPMLVSIVEPAAEIGMPMLVLGPLEEPIEPAVVRVPAADAADDVFNERGGRSEAADEIRDSWQTQQQLAEEDAAAELALNQRSARLLEVLGDQFRDRVSGRGGRASGDGRVSFMKLVERNNRKQVATKFSTLLVLAKLQAVGIRQNGPYEDIEITRGQRFDVVSGN